MKKIISIILLCALLVICLSGCNSNNNGDNTEQSSTTVATSRFKPNLKKNPPASDTPTEPQVLDNESELIKILVKYLQELSWDADMYFLSLSDKINTIKGGREALYVGFDSLSYYYVCAYYNSDHELEEKDYYCCGTEYTWVRFEKESEIQEYYNDEKFLAGFQLNRSLGVTNILSVEADVPDMEVFTQYKPEFKEGLNVAVPNLVKEDFYIFLNRLDEDTIYTVKYPRNSIIPCLQIEDRHYIYTYDIEEWNFGKYHERLMSIVHTEKIDNYGTVGLISIEDFVNEIIKK